MKSPQPEWSPRKVKALRKKLALSQEAFAHRLGVTFTTVNRWENGKAAPMGPYVKLLEGLAASSKHPVAPGFKPERMIVPADQVPAFGGPSIEEMKELWGKVPGSVLVENGELKPIWV